MRLRKRSWRWRQRSFDRKRLHESNRWWMMDEGNLWSIWICFNTFSEHRPLTSSANNKTVLGSIPTQQQSRPPTRSRPKTAAAAAPTAVATTTKPTEAKSSSQQKKRPKTAAPETGLNIDNCANRYSPPNDRLVKWDCCRKWIICVRGYIDRSIIIFV